MNGDVGMHMQEIVYYVHIKIYMSVANVACTTITAGMSIDDVREYEKKLHEETNQKVLDGMDIADFKPDT